MHVMLRFELEVAMLEGSLAVADLPEACREKISSLDKAIACGRFDELRNWLCENIHCYGSKFEPLDLLKRISGDGIRPEIYIKYLREKYSAIYGL